MDNRGRLLFVGDTGYEFDTIKGQKKKFVKVIMALSIGIIMAILSALNLFTLAGSSLLALGIFLALILIFIITLITIGFETYAIYENGITTRDIFFTDFLRGKRFHPFEGITKIGYGIRELDGGIKSEFIVLYENNSEYPTIGNYTRAKFKNDFYERLIETLKQKCPNAEWAEVNWDLLPTWKK